MFGHRRVTQLRACFIYVRATIQRPCENPLQRSAEVRYHECLLITWTISKEM